MTHRTETPDAEAAGEEYAMEQLGAPEGHGLGGTFFMDWVRSQLLEASRMDPSTVLPLETRADARVIARNMLKQLEWDTKRDLNESKEFFKGFSDTLRMNDAWLADELLEINREMRGRDVKENIMARTPLHGRQAPRHRMNAGHHIAPDDAEAVGAQYAQDQINGDYFMDWVRSQLLEASRMDPSTVLPLETRADARVIARNMLKQLEWDTKRDLEPREIASLIGVDSTTHEDVKEFFKGFSDTLRMNDAWLAGELLEINREIRGGGVGEARESRHGGTAPLKRQQRALVEAAYEHACETWTEVPAPEPDLGIQRWAAGSALTLQWARGEGDARQIGWERADGYRAIETNGDPILEDSPEWSEAAWLGLDDIFDESPGLTVAEVVKRFRAAGEAHRYAVPPEPPRHFVADFNTLDDLIEHARQEGATHVLHVDDEVHLYFQRRDGQYEKAEIWQKDGYWHTQGPGSRVIVRRPPKNAQVIGGGRRTAKARRRSRTSHPDRPALSRTEQKAAFYEANWRTSNLPADWEQQWDRDYDQARLERRERQGRPSAS